MVSGMMQFGEVLRRPRLFVEWTIALAVLLPLTYWWLGVNESTTERLALSAAGFAAILAIWLGLLARSRSVLSRSAGDAPGWLGRIGAALLFAAAVAVGLRLVWWVPALDSLAAQVVSMAVRFGIAYGLTLLTGLNLVAAFRSVIAPRI